MSGLALPAEAIWSGAEIVTWLRGLGLGVGWMTGSEGPDVPVEVGPYVPDMPDCLFVVTPIPGAGATMEGIGDVTGFQLRTRGPQVDPDAAERMAKIADRMIRDADFPVDVAAGGLRLVRILRSGAGPAELPTDDSGDRTTLTCNYLTEIIR